MQMLLFPWHEPRQARVVDTEIKVQRGDNMVKSAMQTSPVSLIHLFVTALAVVPLLSDMGCAAQKKNIEPEQRLFSDAPDRGKIDQAMRSRIIRYRFVTVNLQMIAAAKETNQSLSNPGSALQLNLFDDAIFSVVLDRREVLSETSVVWLGHIEGLQDSQVSLAVDGNVMVGNIRIQQSLYQVRYLGDGTHVLYQIDPTAFPPDSEPLVAPSDRK